MKIYIKNKECDKKYEDIEYVFSELDRLGIDYEVQ